MTLTAPTTTDVGDMARRWRAAGACVVPPMEDGSKRPAGQYGRWEQYQTRLPTDDEFAEWFGARTHRRGLGIVCGAVSGHLEMLEFEGRAVEDGTFLAFIDAANDRNLGALVARVVDGYEESTPGGGLHFFFRCDEGVPGDTCLARNVDGEVLIETRGEGGYTIVAPSHGTVHRDGVYELQIGGPERIAYVTAAELAALHDLAGTFDTAPGDSHSPVDRNDSASTAAEAAVGPASPRPGGTNVPPERDQNAGPATHVSDDERPGDWFNRTTSCNDVLAEIDGWERMCDTAKARHGADRVTTANDATGVGLQRQRPMLHLLHVDRRRRTTPRIRRVRVVDSPRAQRRPESGHRRHSWAAPSCFWTDVQSCHDDDGHRRRRRTCQLPAPRSRPRIARQDGGVEPTVLRRKIAPRCCTRNGSTDCTAIPAVARA